ncbi:unnamed protein product [Prorocentrum cordatum]|uniref:Uncharacterized protein n=1 Tax=Prorocentrum cordatum TaxID=2364126 RepID=A0ABN9WAN9_9DINO|nr:unnamed protein product [Polarella glacialis]
METCGPLGERWSPPTTSLKSLQTVLYSVWQKCVKKADAHSPRAVHSGTARSRERKERREGPRAREARRIGAACDAQHKRHHSEAKSAPAAHRARGSKHLSRLSVVKRAGPALSTREAPAEKKRSTNALDIHGPTLWTPPPRLRGHWAALRGSPARGEASPGSARPRDPARVHRQHGRRGGSSLSRTCRQHAPTAWKGPARPAPCCPRTAWQTPWPPATAGSAGRTRCSPPAATAGGAPLPPAAPRGTPGCGAGRPRRCRPRRGPRRRRAPRAPELRGPRMAENPSLQLTEVRLVSHEAQHVLLHGGDALLDEASNPPPQQSIILSTGATDRAGRQRVTEVHVREQLAAHHVPRRAGRVARQARLALAQVLADLGGAVPGEHVRSRLQSPLQRRDQDAGRRRQARGGARELLELRPGECRLRPARVRERRVPQPLRREARLPRRLHGGLPGLGAALQALGLCPDGGRLSGLLLLDVVQRLAVPDLKQSLDHHDRRGSFWLRTLVGMEAPDGTQGVATSAAGACEAKSVADMPGLAQ